MKEINENIGTLEERLFLETDAFDRSLELLVNLRVEDKLEKKNERIKELETICKMYAISIYSFIGNIDKNNLNQFNKTALEVLKSNVDSNIKDPEFKAYLEHKFIFNDYEEYMNNLYRETLLKAEEANNSFVFDQLSDDIEEDVE